MKKWQPSGRQADPVKLALVGFTLAVLGSYVNAYDVGEGPRVFWNLGFKLILLSAFASGVFVGLWAMWVGVLQGRGLAVLPVVLMGVLLILALNELSSGEDDTNYYLAIVPVLAGVLTAWAFAAFRAPRRRAPLHERLGRIRRQ